MNPLSVTHVHVPAPSSRHFALLRDLLGRLGTADNLTTDAHLAALAIGRGYELHSTDTDFARFHGLKWSNPLAAERVGPDRQGPSTEIPDKSFFGPVGLTPDPPPPIL